MQTVQVGKSAPVSGKLVIAGAILSTIILARFNLAAALALPLWVAAAWASRNLRFKGVRMVMGLCLVAAFLTIASGLATAPISGHHPATHNPNNPAYLTPR